MHVGGCALRIANIRTPTARCLCAAQRFSVLGSTGSIGTQTLDIMAEFPDKFKLVALAAGSNVQLLAEQVGLSHGRRSARMHRLQACNTVHGHVHVHPVAAHGACACVCR